MRTGAKTTQVPEPPVIFIYLYDAITMILSASISLAALSMDTQ